MAYKIALNGSNHVSEARVRAFERSLAEGARTEKANRSPDPQAEALRGEQPEDRSVSASPSAVAVAQPSASQDHSPPVDYPRVLDSLERGLTQSYGHQSETLRVHNQYLSNEAAYAQLFAQLMEEQRTLFGNGATSSERADVVLNVLQTLARSVEQFHVHQSETLSVHNQFLAQQANYSQAFVTLLQEHYGTVLRGNGNGNGNGHGHGNGNGHSPLSGKGHESDEAAGLPRMEEKVTQLVATPSSPTPSYVMVPQAPVQIEAPPPSVVPAPQDVIPAGEGLSALLLSIVSDKTGYPVEMLDLDMDMEADLGIDSIKRVEILGALQDAHPDLPEIETEVVAELRTLGQIVAYTAQSGQLVRAPASSRDPVAPMASEPLGTGESQAPAVESEALSGDALRDDLLAIVSDKTGYPVEMLDLDMDMEADLGIDSIKRVEILGALQDQHPDLPEVEADALAELRTLAQILGYMTQATVALEDGAEPKKA
jgi:acyl carrier protein